MRHYMLIDYLPKDIDILFSSILFIVVSIIISHYIFHTLEKLELQTYQKEIEAKALFDNSADGIFVFNARGEALDMNEGAKILSGRSTTDSLTFDMLFPTSLSSFNLDYTKKEIDLPRIFESTLTKKDGTEAPVSLTLSDMKDLPDSEDKIAVIARDLSERKHMENVIKELYAEATQKHYETESLYQISRKMATIRDLSTHEARMIFETVAHKIQKLLNVRDVSIILRTSGQKDYSFIASTQNDNFPDYAFLKEEGWEEFEFIDDNIIIPFESKDTNVGFIIAEGAQKIKTSMQQQEVVKSIKQIFSITIENSQLYRKLKEVTIIEERERLAREMHDGLAQDVSSISMKLQVLKSFIPIHNNKSIDAVKLQKLVNDLEKLTNEAYHEIRHHLFNLRTPFHMQKPFNESLANYADIFEQQTCIKVNLLFDGFLSKDDNHLSQDVKVHVIRIIQEALSNVKKHANATEVTLKMSRLKNGGWQIVIEDNGNGFNYEYREGGQERYGLGIMKERTSLVGGEFHIDTRRGTGTRIILSVP